MATDGAALLLNKSWYPITTVDMVKALSMLYEGRVYAIDPKTYQTYNFDSWKKLSPNNDRVVRTVSFTMQLPEILVSLTFNKVIQAKIRCCRRNLLRRDMLICQYCGKQFHAGELTIDHIIPRSRGGITSWKNCVAACKKCNSRKGNRLPHEVDMHLQGQPIVPMWTPSFSAAESRIPKSWEQFLIMNSK